MRRAALVLVLALATPAAAEPLRIGLGAPLSGPETIFGTQLRQGVEQAVADIDADDGFLGRKAVVVDGDDGGDPKKGVEVANGFLRAGINLVIGDFSSAVTVPASAVYAEAGALDITPSATEPLVTDRGLATVFRMCGREDQQAATAAAFVLGRHYTRIAVLHDRTSVGKGLADSVRAALADRNIDIFYGSFADTTHDVSGLIGRMRATSPQIVFWGGGAAGAATLVRQLREAGAHLPVLGGLAIASDEFPSLAGAAAEGTLLVFPQDPRRRPAAADLLRRLKAKGIDPGGYVFYAYAAVQVIRQAAAQAHSLDPKALAATMHAGSPYQTVIGPIAFDAKGDPKTSDLTVYVWHKGPTGRMTFSDPASS